MTDPATLDQDRAASRRKAMTLAVLAGIGAVAGAVGGYVAENALDLSDAGWPDILAGAVGLALLVSAAASTGAVLLRKATVPSNCAWLQIATLLLAGVMLLLPMIAPSTWAPGVAFGLVIVLFGLQTWANLRLWRIGDELLRRVIVETGAASFWGLQGALFLYAAAERLHLVPTVTAWGLIGVLMTAYVIASSVVSVRRGFC